MKQTNPINEQLKAANEKILLVRERRLVYEHVANALIEYGQTYGIDSMELVRNDINELFDEALGKND